MIPLSRPPVDDQVRAAVLAALDSGQYVLGPECRALEGELAASAGVRHAVLVSSGTAALWVALRALRLRPGAEVLVPAHTAFPTVEAILAAGGRPVFVDADDGYGLDPADAAARLTPATAGVVAVHLYGQPCDLDAVQALAARRGLWVLEDCAQAQGARWHGRPVGGFGRAAALSFYPSKNLPGFGDGGAVLTDDDTLAAGCRRLRDHGRTGKQVHAEVGFNLRFNDLQAAALRVLLPRLEAMNAHRRALAARYDAGLRDLPLTRPAARAHAHHVYHLYVIRSGRRDELREFLAARGIQTGIHYAVPAHQQPAAVDLGAPVLPRTELLVKEILSLPLSAGHTEEEIDRVIGAVRAFHGRDADVAGVARS